MISCSHWGMFHRNPPRPVSFWGSLMKYKAEREVPNINQAGTGTLMPSWWAGSPAYQHLNFNFGPYLD